MTNEDLQLRDLILTTPAEQLLDLGRLFTAAAEHPRDETWPAWVDAIVLSAGPPHGKLDAKEPNDESQ